MNKNRNEHKAFAHKSFKMKNEKKKEEEEREKTIRLESFAFRRKVEKGGIRNQMDLSSRLTHVDFW